MSVTRTFNTSNVLSFGHTSRTVGATIPAGTDLLLAIKFSNGDEAVTGISWNTSEALSLIWETPNTAAGDAGFEIWGLVSPTATTANAVFSLSSTAPYGIYVLLGYSGVVTDSLGAATNVIDGVDNTGNGSTTVLVGGGTAGNAEVLAAGQITHSGNPASNSNESFTQIYNITSGDTGGTGQDGAMYVAELLSGLPSGSATITWSDSEENAGARIELVAAPVAPDLSSPTAHNVTQTAVTPRVTTDTANGTLYMVLVPDADVPSVSQIKAGQQSSGAAAIAAANQAVSATGVQSFTAVTGLTSSTAYELYFVHTNSGAQDSTASTVGFSTQAANTPEVTVEPTVSDVTGTAYTIDLGTVTTTGTAYAGLYPDGATPTEAQIKAGTGAIVAGSKATTADTAIGTLVLTNLDSPHDPKVDVKVVYEAATDVFSSIQTISDVFADPPAGKQYIGLGAGPYASWLDSANPAPVNGDVLIWDSVTTPGAYAFVVLASGDFSYDSGGDTSRQTGTRELWRAADQSFSGTQEFAVNNLAPEVPGEGIEFDLLENVAFGPYNLVAVATDPEGDTMTGAQSPDDLAAVPPGIAYTDGNMVVTEASLVADTYGNIYRVTDEWGDFGEYSIQFDVSEWLTNPIAVSIGSTSVTPRVTTPVGTGTLYFVVVPDADSPSVAQIKLGQDSLGAAAIASGNQAVSGTGEQSFPRVTGLGSETAYEIWFVQTAENDSEAVTVGFSTTALPVFRLGGQVINISGGMSIGL